MAIIPGILSMWINTLIQSTAFTLINTFLKYGPPNKTKQSAFGQASPQSRLLLSSTLYTYSSCFNSYLHHANTTHGAPLGLAPRGLSAHLLTPLLCTVLISPELCASYCSRLSALLSILSVNLLFLLFAQRAPSSP